MTFASRIESTRIQPRVVLHLNDGGTDYYFSHSTTINSDAENYKGRVLNFSPLTIQSGMALQEPSMTITLSDQDGYIEGLGIDLSWSVLVKITDARDTMTDDLVNEIKMDLVVPPTFYSGVCTLQLKAPVRSDLGEIYLPKLTQADVSGFGDEYLDSLVGMVFPAYFGYWNDEQGPIPTTQLTRDGLFWGIGVTSTPASDDDYTSRTSVYVSFDDGEHKQLVNSATYTLSSLTVSRASEYPTSWELWYIQFTSGGIYDYLLYSGDPNFTLWISLDAAVPTYNRVDGNPRLASTVGCVAKNIATYYLSVDDAQLGISEGIPDAVLDALEDNGIQTRFIIEERAAGIDVINNLIARTGLAVWYYRTTGNSYSYYYKNDDQAETAGGYSSETLYRDWQHCLGVNRQDRQLLNDIELKTYDDNLHIEDTASQTAAYKLNASLGIDTLTKSAAYAMAWRMTQGRRDLITPRRLLLIMPLVAAEMEPGNIYRLIERWAGLASAPVQVEMISIDFQACVVSVLVQDLSGWTDTDAYILVYEFDLERLEEPAVANVDTGNSYVYLSTDDGASYGFEVGDIFETYSDVNHYSAKITAIPTWEGGVRWRMTVDSVADTTDVLAPAEYRVCKSYITATSAEQAKCGFLCDTDGEFSDNDAGKKLMF